MKKFILICGCIVAISSPVFAQDNSILAGAYKSLNGKIEHYFAESGDYTGVANFDDASKTYNGVYRFADDICWLPGPNGSKGATGNVIIHYEEEQCCLSLESIADKIAVTYIWSKPYPQPIGLCSSQVLRRE